MTINGLKCLYRKNTRCTLTGCLNGCKKAPKQQRIHTKHTPNYWNKNYQRIIHQTDLICQALEKQEWLHLTTICPEIQKTDNPNQATAICLTCNNPTHCKTNSSKETKT